MPDADSPLKPVSYSFVIANSHLIDLDLEVLDPQDQTKKTPDLTHMFFESISICECRDVFQVFILVLALLEVWLERV